MSTCARVATVSATRSVLYTKSSVLHTTSSVIYTAGTAPRASRLAPHASRHTPRTAPPRAARGARAVHLAERGGHGEGREAVVVYHLSGFRRL